MSLLRSGYTRGETKAYGDWENVMGTFFFGAPRKDFSNERKTNAFSVSHDKWILYGPKEDHVRVSNLKCLF